MSWRELAWNGIRFSAPADWETAKIGPCYLLLTRQGECALEIKWGKARKRFTPRAALRRLKSLHRDAIQETPLSEEWQRALSRFTGTGFSWQAEAKGGKGAALHCPACGNATLIQFFQPKSDLNDKTCLRILQSFQDHSAEDRVRWCIFDIQAVIPAAYRLDKFRFEAGRFELNFASKKTGISLYRWGPASALLNKEDLAAFGAKAFGSPQSEWHSLSWIDHPAVGWEKRPPAGLWARFRESLTGTRHYQRKRLWHLAEKNRIMGVAISGNKPCPSEGFDAICLSYESL
jgi:hypothetical protein